MCSWIHIFLNILRLAFFRRLLLPYLKILYYLTLAGIIIFPLCPGLLVQICAFSSVTGNKGKESTKSYKMIPLSAFWVFWLYEDTQSSSPCRVKQIDENISTPHLAFVWRKYSFKGYATMYPNQRVIKIYFHLISFKKYLIYDQIKIQILSQLTASLAN